MPSSENWTNPKHVLTVSLSRHLTGHPIDQVIAKDWAKNPEAAKLFNNLGFDFDGNDIPASLQGLRETLNERNWDGILIGWCIRGNPSYTVLFEKIVDLCNNVVRKHPQTKLIF